MRAIDRWSKNTLRMLLTTHLLLCFAPSFCSSEVRAQCSTCKAAGAVKPAVMGEGEAKIAVQSNLRISIKGERATNALRVDAVGQAIGAKTARLKACYAQVVTRDPTRVGAVEVALAFDETRSEPKVDFRQNAGFTPDMLSCLRQILEAVSLDSERRPASVLATLEFSNSRAQGQEAMQERAGQSAAESVAINATGKFEAAWSAPGAKVSLTTVAEPSENRESVVAAQRILRKALGTFLDCRRKAAKAGASPAGETVVDLVWSSRSHAEARIQSTTLSKEPAVSCIKKAFNRLKLEQGPDRGHVTVTVAFGE
jgi:hypothetical protein